MKDKNVEDDCEMLKARARKVRPMFISQQKMTLNSKNVCNLIT